MKWLISYFLTTGLSYLDESVEYPVLFLLFTIIVCRLIFKRSKSKSSYESKWKKERSEYIKKYGHNDFVDAADKLDSEIEKQWKR